MDELVTVPSHLPLFCQLFSPEAGMGEVHTKEFLNHQFILTSYRTYVLTQRLSILATKPKNLLIRS